MEKRRYLYNPAFEDDTIQSFSETPGIQETKTDLEEAENETTEIQDTKEDINKPDDPDGEDASTEESDDSEAGDANDMSDEELMALPEYRVVALRFIPPGLDYGTPAGSDSSDSGGCPGCSDAADTAIVDAEVAPSEGSNRPESDEEDTGDSGGFDSFGEDTEEEGGIGEELRAYIDLRIQYQEALKKQQRLLNSSILFSAPSLPGMEGFVDHLLTALGFISKKVAKYTRKVYLLSRNKISKVVLRSTTIAKLWNFKLSRNLEKVNMDKLSSLECEAFPYEIWTATAKFAINTFDMCRNAEKIVSTPGKAKLTPEMERFNREMDDVGISLNLNTNKLDMSRLLDRRQHASILDLGYSKGNIPNVLRYFNEIAKRIPNPKNNPLEEACNKCMKGITEYAGSVNKDIESGRIEEGSYEYQESTDRVMACTVRFDFILNCQKLTYDLFDRLTADAIRIFGRYEDALSFGFMTD